MRVASKSLNDLRETIYWRVSPAVFRFPAFAGPGLVTSFGTTPATSTTHRIPMGAPEDNRFEAKIRPDCTDELTATLRRRIMVIDGAMGTAIQRDRPDEVGYRGERFIEWPTALQGNNDLLTLTQPDIIAGIHREYLEADADILETNTFNSNAVSLADYGMAELAYELNYAGAALARAVCDEFSTVDKPRYVAGAIGPTTRTALISPDVTVVSTVPTLAALWPAEALEAVRLLIFGGEACPPELAERLVTDGREVWNTYGPTEATVVSCGAKLTGGAPVSIGLPLPGWDLAVVGAAGEPVAPGEVGELVIGGVGLARYLDPEKDAEKYAPMPTLGWPRAYRSGDLVQYEEAGLLFLGRADDQVKVGGRRIELGEIDSALLALPGVSGTALTVGVEADTLTREIEGQPS